MTHPYIEYDKRFTERLRNWGRSHLQPWKWMAAKGLYLFAIPWIFLVWQGWLTWFVPIIPLVTSYVALLIMQAIVKRERPDYERLSGYKMLVRTYSFPSGHATESTALALSLLLYTQFPDAFLMIGFGMVLLVLAMMISYARIAVGVHYVADVVAGLALGVLFVIGFFICAS